MRNARSVISLRRGPFPCRRGLLPVRVDVDSSPAKKKRYYTCSDKHWIAGKNYMIPDTACCHAYMDGSESPILDTRLRNGSNAPRDGSLGSESTKLERRSQVKHTSQMLQHAHRSRSARHGGRPYIHVRSRPDSRARVLVSRGQDMHPRGRGGVGPSVHAFCALESQDPTRGNEEFRAHALCGRPIALRGTEMSCHHGHGPPAIKAIYCMHCALLLLWLGLGCRYILLLGIQACCDVVFYGR
jgi:hypothetical protein